MTLGRELLVRHFRATAPEHVVGLHTTAPDNTSRWGAVELDGHDGPDPPDPEVLFAAAEGWYRRQAGMGFRPLLTDSNGKGGLHLLTIFSRPVPTAAVFAFLQRLTDDFAAYGLAARPETFPKQARVTDKNPFGNWLRVPGRHHTREHLSRAWDGNGWLEGGRAIDFILTLDGDDPGPARVGPGFVVRTPDGIEVSIRGYLARLPRLAAGQNRHKVAYTLAAFLARDLARPDDEVMRWLGEWDQGNSPPLGPDELRQQLACAHQYGQRPYGSGLRDAGGPARPPGAAKDGGKQDAYRIILGYFREYYQPVFRRGDAIYSELLGRDVTAARACRAPGIDLVNRLEQAIDAPKDAETGAVKWRSLIKLFGDWSKVAWQDLVETLPDEPAAAEVSPKAGEELKVKLAQALHAHVALGATRYLDNGEQVTRDERRTLVNWCSDDNFCLLGKWTDVRGYRIWARKEADGRIRATVHPGLFAQVGPRELKDLGPKELADLGELYGVGVRGRLNCARVVEWNADFLAEHMRVSPFGPGGGTGDSVTAGDNAAVTPQASGEKGGFVVRVQ